MKIIKGERIIPCHERNSKIPLNVNDVILKMLSINPEYRFSSNKEAIQELSDHYFGRIKKI